MKFPFKQRNVFLWPEIGLQNKQTNVVYIIYDIDKFIIKWKLIKNIRGIFADFVLYFC